MKNEVRAKLRPLRGLDELLNFPSHYRDAVMVKIKELESTLLTRASGSVSLQLDTTPNARLDKDPGELSGDCTAGKPLEFGEATGLHNVRVSAEGKHIGNIYLLESTTSEGVPVWHIDAVQIPLRTVDWSQFPDLLVDALRPLAVDCGVQGITVNKRQHHVSNYDYISRGFMEYFGTGDKAQAYDQLELLDEPGVISDREDLACDVQFDRFHEPADDDNTTSQPQGAKDSQIYLWRAETPTTDGAVL